jgi:hypothetical protein
LKTRVEENLIDRNTNPSAPIDLAREFIDRLHSIQLNTIEAFNKSLIDGKDLSSLLINTDLGPPATVTRTQTVFETVSNDDHEQAVEQLLEGGGWESPVQEIEDQIPPKRNFVQQLFDNVQQTRSKHRIAFAKISSLMLQELQTAISSHSDNDTAAVIKLSDIEKQISSTGDAVITPQRMFITLIHLVHQQQQQQQNNTIHLVVNEDEDIIIMQQQHHQNNTT